MLLTSRRVPFTQETRVQITLDDVAKLAMSHGACSLKRQGFKVLRMMWPMILATLDTECL